MKWKLICVLIISLLSIRVIGCWPFSPPPPPPPPPLHLFEDHYVRFQGPYDHRGLTHMASHPSGQSVQPMSPHHSPHHMPHHLFYPAPSMNPIPHLNYAESQGRLFDDNPDFDLGSTREFMGFGPKIGPKPLMKVRHMNYRYRKLMKTQRPVQENGFSHQKDIKYSQSFNPQPRRYNVIDGRGEYQKRIPNSVNDQLDQLSPNQKKVFTEEESNRQNSSANKTDKSDRKSEKDLQENSSQNKDISNSIKQSMEDMPIEVTSYSVKSPDGAVTQVTEMLYDVENNPFRTPTPPPMVSPYWRPSTPLIKSITESVVTESPYLKNSFSESETDSTLKSQPINTAVTAQFNDMTTSPYISFTSQRNTMDPFPIFTLEPTLPPTPPRLRSSVAPSDYYTRRTRKRLSTQRPSSTTSRNSARESKPGLSGAAIAGIVIGSMVSIMLLAGNSINRSCLFILLIDLLVEKALHSSFCTEIHFDDQ